MRIKILIWGLTYLLLSVFSVAQTEKRVPAEYPTIQEAIDASSDGDVILVAPGTYAEGINFYGKNIIVQSEDGPLLTFLTPADWGGSIVWFHNGESASAKLIGFTLRDSHCCIAGPVLNFGHDSHPTIENCIITDNPGGIYYYYSGAVLKNCLIFGNTTNLLFKFDANRFHPEMINCTIADNKDAVLSNPQASVKLKNCIIYGNDEWGIAGNVDISYSLVEGGFVGEGNIDADPLFVDVSNNDYHLQANSPCIDTGTDFGAPSSDIDGMLRPKGAWYDMGAYEAYLSVVLIPYTPDPTNDNTPTLDWWDVVGASTYTLQYSGQSDFSTYTEATNITESIYEITDALSDGMWYWRVRALDSEGVAGWWTAADNFVVEPVFYTLTIAAGMGGTTIPSPDTYVHVTGTEVSITAVPDTNYRFNGWTGDVPSGHENDNAITITMDSDKSIEANFIRQYTLTIARGAGGTTDPTPGYYAYDIGAEVSITATPDTGYRFANWSGDASGTDNGITITIDGDKSITANFIRQYTLTLASGSGGTIDPSPDTYTYDTGTEVTIKAIPSSGYEFSGWSGNASGTTNPITITIDSDKSVTANFKAIPPTEEPKKKGGCFVATAAYGSPLHPHIDILREFRDEHLMTNKFGRGLVKLYYKYSPFVANLITKHKILKVAVRISLLPFVAFSYSMLHFGLIITTVMHVLVSVFPIFFISFFRRRKRRMEAKDLKPWLLCGVYDAVQRIVRR